MKIEINEKREVPLLSRMRVQATAVFEKETPSRDEIRKSLSSMLNADENLLIIKHIYTKFGKREAKVIAHLYKNLDDLKRIEEAHLLKKHFKEEKKAEGAPPAEAKV